VHTEVQAESTREKRKGYPASRLLAPPSGLPKWEVRDNGIALRYNEITLIYI
jgi:hypothetical protein